MKIAKLQGEVNAIQAKIDAMPGWRKGAFGTIGGSFLVLTIGMLEPHLLQWLEVLELP